jgi:DNA-binding GntR family transcriptional regulator
MAATTTYLPAPHPADLAKLRLLVELPALRQLAVRGLSDLEIEIARKLADATMAAARSGDGRRYWQADTAFHRCLLELAAGPALREVAHVLAAAGTGSAPRCEPRQLLILAAREHRELVGLLADGRVSAADHLLRWHQSRRADRTTAWPGRPEPAASTEA